MKQQTKDNIKKFGRISLGIIAIFIFISHTYPNANNSILRTGIIIILIGMCLNLTCIFSNNLKMPVYNGGENYIHTSYTNRKKIKFWLLSDFIFVIIPNFKKKEQVVSIYSIGDVCIYLGLLITLIGMII